MLKVFCCDSSIMKLNLYTTLVFFQLHLKCQCQWDFLACTVWIIQLTEFAKTVFPGNCTGQRWVKLSTVRDSGEPSQADRGQGHRWVKLSTVRDNAKSSWALSGTALSHWNTVLPQSWNYFSLWLALSHFIIAKNKIDLLYKCCTWGNSIT